MVTILLNTIYAQGTRNSKGFLQCIREFLPHCFSLNRQDYARNLSYYNTHMTNLENSHPNMFNHMLNQGFTVLSRQPFTWILRNQVIEVTINCSSKDTGRLSGKAENAGASECWMWLSHLVAILREKLYQVARKRTSRCHVDLGMKRLLSDKKDVDTLASCLFEWIPMIWEDDQPFINLAT